MTDSLSLSNSLSDLSARIRVEHHATSAALKSSVEHAMAAGDLLLEAKALVPHGQWLPWLAEHCEMSERTAQLYMRTAKNRAAVELQMRNTVADLTLNEAAALLFLTSDIKKLLAFTKQISETTDPEQVLAVCLENGVGVIRDTGYDMWFGTNAEQKREWTLYARFLVDLGMSPDGAGGSDRVATPASICKRRRMDWRRRRGLPPPMYDARASAGSRYIVAQIRVRSRQHVSRRD